VSGRNVYDILCTAIDSYNKTAKKKTAIINTIIRETCKEMGVTINEVKGKSKRNDRRTYATGIIAYLGRKFTDLSYKEIGKQLNKEKNLYYIYYVKIRDIQQHPDKVFAKKIQEIITRLETRIKLLIDK
jgi:chromosomal replication initiation ATPase DnaA